MKNILIFSLVILFGGCAATYNQKEAIKIVDNKIMKKSYKKYLDNNTHKYKALSLAYSGDSIKGSATLIVVIVISLKDKLLKLLLDNVKKKKFFIY